MADPLQGLTSFTYDDTGNRLTQTDPSGTITSTWDARNRLTAMTGPSLAASFAYDGLGRRAQRTVNGGTITFLYDGLDVVQESSGGADAAYLRTLAIDEALVRTDTADTAHFLGDALGSTVALTNPGGTAATTYTFEPFGHTEVSGTPNPNAFRYTGREDDGTGLYYYRARYYDQTRSRFVSEDPIGLAGGINEYWYASNDPVGLGDPLGLYVAGIGLGGGGNYWRLSGSGDCSLVWDDRGNRGIVCCYGSAVGGPKGKGAYVGLSTTHVWGVETVCDMKGEGWGGSAGRSGAAGGGAGPALNVAGNFQGINVNTGFGFGWWGFFGGWGRCQLLQCWGECCNEKQCKAR